MKTNRKGALIRLSMLTTLAICFSAVALSAQDYYEVKFTLPFETQWEGIVLPAGEYSVLLDSFPTGRFMRLQQGVKNIGHLLPITRETPVTPAKSQLLIVREGNVSTVHILYIDGLGTALGTAFHFPVPERYEVYTQLIARADEPAAIQRIPVVVSGK
jgi:hypothetical protein